ncbi:unnamed protein product [Ambrosiozyma monospora]|uniref:Unnamed protein product n=1 Tax=Ambrosiozyma monospora TaxID=43982 RepID=A0ACB5TDG9_AMBMO|nr:unnamed protein product [Ambrosiozyma monospora]
MAVTSVTEDQQLKAPFLKLYAAGTGNGYKILILLELLGIDYYFKSINLLKGEQREPWFLAINGNGRIPSIVDVDDHGNKTELNESIAILSYLAEKFDKDRKFSYDHNDPLYYKQLEWMLFQATTLAPPRGQMTLLMLDNRLGKAKTEQVDYVIEKYRTETVRCFELLEKQLLKNGTGYLIGDHLSIVDVAVFPYIDFDFEPKLENELKEFKFLSQWANKIAALPEITRAKQIVETSPAYLF